MRSIAVATMAAVIVLSTSSTRAQHHTFRFFTSSGSPIGVNTIAISPDNKLLAISTKNGKTSLISISDGQIQYEHKLAPFSMNFNADGSHLLMIAPRDTQLLNVADKQISRVAWNVGKGALGFVLETRSGKLLVKSIVPGSPAAEARDMRVGDELVAITSGGKRRSLLGHSVAKAIAALSGPAGAPVTLHLVHNGQLDESKLTLRRQPAEVVDGDLHFSPPSDATTSPNVALAFSEGCFVLLNAANGNVLSALMPVEVRPAGQYAVSPDGRYFGLVAKGLQSSQSAVEIFDVAKQERIVHERLPEDNFYDAAFLSDSKAFLIGSQDRIQILQLDTGQFAEPFFFRSRPASAATADEADKPTGSTALAARGAAAKEVGPFPDSWTGADRQRLSRFAISPAGVVAIGTSAGSVQLWSLGKQTRLSELLESTPGRNRRPVERIEFSPSGEWLAFYVGGTLHVVKTPAIPAD